jgi:hypothetical protein
MMHFDDPQVPDFPVDPEELSISQHWSDGTERFSSWSAIDFLNALGLIHQGNERMEIPGVAKWINDANSDFDPWVNLYGLSPEAIERYFRHNANTSHAIRPLWHQLSGTYCMLDGIFDGRPMLLMDAVGVGKTFECILLVLILIYFNEYFMRHGKFPGAFGIFPPSFSLSFA